MERKAAHIFEREFFDFPSLKRAFAGGNRVFNDGLRDEIGPVIVKCVDAADLVIFPQLGSLPTVLQSVAAADSDPAYLS
jgi:hypothetical protein